MATKWGICGLGKISHEFAAAMKLLPQKDHKIVAVASRSQRTAEKFAKDFGAERSYGSYQELALDPDIDIVYVGVLHTGHFLVSKLFIENNKHVLVEKPMTCSVAETKELTRLAKEKKLFLMEALWSNFFPVYEEIKKKIEGEDIGRPLNVVATFGLDIFHVPRLSQKDLGGGAIWDIGIYTINLALVAFNWQKPSKIIAGGHSTMDGVDYSASVTLLFSEGQTATLIINASCNMDCCAYIYGANDYFKIEHPFHCPTKYSTSSKKYEIKLPTDSHDYNFINSEGLCYQIAAVRKSLLQGKLENEVMPHSKSVLIAEIMEESMRQINSSK